MTKHSVQHATFTIERHYDAAPAVVFHAFADQKAKENWFAGPDQWTLLEREMAFRAGGRERLKGKWANGATTTFDAYYYDIVLDERIVYAYEMHIDDRKISVSLATVEFRHAGAGTMLTVIEQGAFLDGYDDAGSREKGTRDLLDNLEKSLRIQAAH
jgi:uncharacterized protein YndB with AHSA1/START domain